MYYCKSCGCEFEKPKKAVETHGFINPPYESYFCCPHCGEPDFYLMEQTHCRCCGAKMNIDESINGYCCKACEMAGEKLRKIERKRRKMKLKSPLSVIVRETDEYNRKNNTNYSYGQYVALVRPSRKGGKHRV